jgi:hypothetical protein
LFEQVQSNKATNGNVFFLKQKDNVGLQLGSKVASLWEPLLTSAHTKLHTTTSLVRHYATLALLGRAKFRRILKHALKKARNQKKLKLD